MLKCVNVIVVRQKYCRSLIVTLNRFSKIFGGTFLKEWVLNQIGVTDFSKGKSTIDDYAKDGGEELFTKMHCLRIMNP